MKNIVPGIIIVFAALSFIIMFWLDAPVTVTEESYSIYGYEDIIIKRQGDDIKSVTICFEQEGIPDTIIIK